MFLQVSLFKTKDLEGVKRMPKTGEVKEVFLERKFYKVHSPSIFENSILDMIKEFRTKKEAVKYAKQMSNLYPKYYWVVSYYQEKEEAVFRTAIKKC